MNPALSLRVVSFARAVRSWAEERADSAEIPSTDLCGWCAIASAQLFRVFERNGIRSEILMWEEIPGGRGNCHVFLTVGNHIVDITATQFDEFYDQPVLIMHYTQACKHNFYRDTKRFATADALRKHQVDSGWPPYQTAYGKYLKMNLT
jgi:hypothetical protein